MWPSSAGEKAELNQPMTVTFGGEEDWDWMSGGQVGWLWLASLNEEGADFLANPNPLGAKPNGMNGEWMGKSVADRQRKTSWLIS